MASPIFVSQPPKSISPIYFIRGAQLALISVIDVLKECNVGFISILLLISLLTHLISNIPIIIVGSMSYLLRFLKIISVERSESITNYWIDYQCHVLDLTTFSFVLLLFLYPSVTETFFKVLMKTNAETGKRLKYTFYSKLTPDSTNVNYNATTSKYQVISFLSKLIPTSSLTNEIIPNLWPLISRYFMDITIITLIHFSNHLPFIGSFVCPISTIQLIYPAAGPYVTIVATLFSIPSLTPKFLVPCAPRRMFSFFKSPVVGDTYNSETSFSDILPISFYFMINRLLKLFVAIYFNKLPISCNQKIQWIKTRFGILAGYTLTIYLISSFLGPLGFLGVFTGLAGMGNLVGKITTPPPIASSVESIPIDEDDLEEDDPNFSETSRSQSSTKLFEMQRVSEWLDKEVYHVFTKEQSLKDFIDDFNRFLNKQQRT